ncbi:hypothetical protein SAMN04487914_11338 [Arthrobacter sp. ok909]|nr:hypothetical protein SAMN04487914_11338 [Arthrobacter sp. ok909]
MTTLPASPAQRIAVQVGPDEMAGTDPYAMGFCVAAYATSDTREVATPSVRGLPRTSATASSQASLSRSGTPTGRSSLPPGSPTRKRPAWSSPGTSARRDGAKKAPQPFDCGAFGVKSYSSHLMKPDAACWCSLLPPAVATAPR